MNKEIKFLKEQIKGINAYIKDNKLTDEKIAELKERKEGFQEVIKTLQNYAIVAAAVSDAYEAL